MNTNSRVNSDLARDIFIFQDESNMQQSTMDRILPTTSIDQVFDYIEPTEPKSLRQILADLKTDILSGGVGAIHFPVTSVNGLTGDVQITKRSLGIDRIDNTNDYEKPLSIPQRNAVLNILSNYNFRTNLDEFYNHFNDYNNPHNVTVDQINSSEELTRFVQNLINSHNLNSSGSHMDIRNNLATLWDYYDYLNRLIDYRIATAIEVSTDHLTDPEAHKELILPKEDKSNKVAEITSNYNYTEYPSTRAVVEFVNSKISEYNTNLNLDLPFISDIRVIDYSNLLPVASESYKKIIYIIKNNSEHCEQSIAVCRYLNNKWYWDIKTTGAISKLNNRYFSKTNQGLTLNLSNISNDLLQAGDDAFNLTNILSHYYTRTEMDNRYISDLTIVPGIDDGTIRYYKNGDESTSERVYIKGLNDLAFLDRITERYIEPESINNTHIIPASVERKHIKNEAVNHNKLECSPLHILGNLSTINTVGQEIPLMDLANILRPLIGGWPDPNNPNNPWNDYFNDLKVSPHLWDPGVEINLHDESFGMRFKGTISCIPNYQFSKKLSSRINLDTGDLIDAGGTWVFSSDPKKKTILGGSNITGHTYGTINIDEDYLYFDSISIGDRVDAEYDIWVRYTKNGTITEGPDYIINATDFGWDNQNYLFEYSFTNFFDPVNQNWFQLDQNITNQHIYVAETSSIYFSEV